MKPFQWRVHVSPVVFFSQFFVLIFLVFCCYSGAVAQEWLYTAQTGDNLWKLSKKHLKSIKYWKRLVELNNVSDPYNIAPGTILRFPIEWLKSGASVATIVELTGEGTVVKRRTGQRLQAIKGMLLWDNDLIITAAESNATLQFADKSRVLLQAGSEMQMEKLVSYGSTGMADTKVRLKSGRTHNNIVPKTGHGSRFEISTPSAIAAVRGTEYRISAEKNGDSRAEVLSGVVGVDSMGDSKMVSGGFGTISFKERTLLEPVKLLIPPDLSGCPDVFYRVPFSFKPQSLSGARKYRVQIAKDEKFSTLLFDSIFPTLNMWGPDLPDDSYFLRVHGIDENGLEGLYSVHHFSIKAHPIPPMQIKPITGAVIEQSKPNFQWSEPQDASAYWLQVADNEEFNKPLLIDEKALVKTVYTPNVEMSPGLYHWRVASVNSHGKVGPYSDSQKFRRLPPKPDMSGAELDSGEMVFRWRKGEKGQAFKCQISRDSNFSDLLVDQKVTEPKYSLKEFDSGSYYIRIAVIDADGYTGPFGAFQTVKVPSAPPHPLAYIFSALFIALLIAL